MVEFGGQAVQTRRLAARLHPGQCLFDLGQGHRPLEQQLLLGGQRSVHRVQKELNICLFDRDGSVKGTVEMAALVRHLHSVGSHTTIPASETLQAFTILTMVFGTMVVLFASNLRAFGIPKGVTFYVYSLEFGSRCNELGYTIIVSAIHFIL